MNIEIIAFTKDEKYRQQTINLIKDLHLCLRPIFVRKLLLINRVNGYIFEHNYIQNN